ncbi:MAG: hypothetical protein ACREM6_15995 [Vulcanimicrobiaceae bacterium]
MHSTPGVGFGFGVGFGVGVGFGLGEGVGFGVGAGLGVGVGLGDGDGVGGAATIEIAYRVPPTGPNPPGSVAHDEPKQSVYFTLYVKSTTRVAGFTVGATETATLPETLLPQPLPPPKPGARETVSPDGGPPLK